MSSFAEVARLLRDFGVCHRPPVPPPLPVFLLRSAPLFVAGGGAEGNQCADWLQDIFFALPDWPSVWDEARSIMGNTLGVMEAIFDVQHVISLSVFRVVVGIHYPCLCAGL